MEYQLIEEAESYFWAPNLDVQIKICEGHTHGVSANWVGILTNLNVPPYDPYYQAVVLQSDYWRGVSSLAPFILEHIAVCCDPDSVKQDLLLIQHGGFMASPFSKAVEALTPSPTDLVKDHVDKRHRGTADRIFDLVRENRLDGISFSFDDYYFDENILYNRLKGLSYKSESQVMAEISSLKERFL